MTPIRVGFIGVGQIGEPMVERLLAEGHSTMIYARRAEVRDRLAAHGAEVVSQPAELAAADVVITCLFTDTQVLDLCGPIIEKMRRGSTFVSHTTGSPNALRALNDIAQSRGVSLVEAPFSGTAQAIRARRLTVLVGGDPRAVDAAAELVAAYAVNIIRTGEIGTALPAKLLNNALFAACTQLTLSALKAATAVGIPESTFLEILSVSSGGSAAAQYIAASGQSAEVYSSGLPRYLRKDIESARIAAADIDLDISTLLAAVRLGPLDLVDGAKDTDALERVAAT
ncbi:MAG: NAD(P)-binding domain-containing protein [Rhodococcus sp. (in: high G+C Gram-positive bacteria)]|uniref:NAD(P)-dependent oxidoreductase n=1 Tax=Rhodococcus sp. TaxID=1831 RepID=UPI003BB088B3